jgi:hypothetical protein
MSWYSVSVLFGHEEAGTWALGLAGSQEKAGPYLNKMLVLYDCIRLNGVIVQNTIIDEKRMVLKGLPLTTKNTR